MAVPVLVGLSWLAGALGSVFVSVVGFLAAYVTKRVALTVAAVAAFGILAAAIIATLDALLAQLIGTFPIAANIGFLMPDGFSTTLGYYFSFRVAYWVYSVNWLIIRMRLM